MLVVKAGIIIVIWWKKYKNYLKAIMLKLIKFLKAKYKQKLKYLKHTKVKWK